MIALRAVAPSCQLALPWRQALGSISRWCSWRRANRKSASTLSIGFGLLIFSTAHGAIASDADIRLGVLRDAPPFSYFDEPKLEVGPEGVVPAENVKGYTVYLCREFAKTLGRDPIFVEVTAKTRFTMLEEGMIDILCGATTASLAVQSRYAASLYTFITGISFLQLHEVRLEQKSVRVGYVGETTASEGLQSPWSKLQEILKRRKDWQGYTFEPEPLNTHFHAFGALASGEIDIYIADRAILEALVAEFPAMYSGKLPKEAFLLSDAYLSVEPYAIISSRNAQTLIFQLNLYLQRLFESGEFPKILARFFSASIDSTFLELVRFQRNIPAGAVPKASAGNASGKVAP